jgi:two-component system sensor histidine kinase KdpD
LADFVQGVVSDVSPTLQNHDVVVDVPADLPPIDVDLVLIARVLTNLLENAVRYAPKRTSIMIRAERASQETIKVSVTDHGPGIDRGRRDEVFGLPARRDRDAGAGLGLTIAQTFVEAHGQNIWVQDAPDSGARFCFTLPIALSIPEEPRVVEGSHR